MSCLLALCLFKLSNVYVTAEMFSTITQGQMEGRWCFDHWCRGALGELRLGLRSSVTESLEADFGIRHTSFIQEGDRGEESAYLSLTWKPFAQGMK